MRCHLQWDRLAAHLLHRNPKRPSHYEAGQTLLAAAGVSGCSNAFRQHFSRKWRRKLKSFACQYWGFYLYSVEPKVTTAALHRWDIHMYMNQPEALFVCKTFYWKNSVEPYQLQFTSEQWNKANPCFLFFFPHKKHSKEHGSSFNMLQLWSLGHEETTTTFKHSSSTRLTTNIEEAKRVRFNTNASVMVQALDLNSKLFGSEIPRLFRCSSLGGETLVLVLEGED